MRKIFLISASLGFLALMPAGASAMDARSACEGDAERLCSAHIPDALAIEQCMRANIGALSPACRAQFGGAAKSAKSTKHTKRRR